MCLSLLCGNSKARILYPPTCEGEVLTRHATLAYTGSTVRQGVVAQCGAVCIKAGDLALALDVFKEMNEKGCTPNLVTYNILIDVRCHILLTSLPARVLCL